MQASRSITESVRRSEGGAAPRWICAVLCLLVLYFTVDRLAGAAAQPPSEYQVKAAFLLNFTKFVDWPESVFASPEVPLSICILGEDPFGAELDKIVEGEAVNSRRLSIQRVRRLPLPACQVLFVGREEKDIPKILAAAHPGVLTVGEGERFLREGGMIALVIDNRRVRFDVNQPAAATAGLQISSKLLNVARNVEK